MHSNVIILVIVCGACLVTDVQLMQCSINGALRRVEQLFQKDQHQDIPECTPEDFKLFNDECLKLEVAQKPPPKGFNINQPASRDSPTGRISEVVRVKYSKPYAVKRINMPWAVKDMKKRGIITFTEICTEMKILQDVEHPFIVKLHWSLWNEKYAVMIFDYYQMDSFLDLIAATGPLSEEKTKFYTAQLVLAIEYLHEIKRIVHRDIKDENILVDNEGYLKITDFGFSNRDDGKPVNRSVGSPSYAAPEVLASAQPGNSGYRVPYLRKPTDIWSLGVVIYTMLFGKFPYLCSDTASILQWISKRGVSVPKEHEYVKAVIAGFGEPEQEKEKLKIRNMLPGPLRTHTYAKVDKNGFGKPELLAPRPKEKLEIREMLQDMFKIDPKGRLTIKQIKDHDSWNTPSAWIKPGSYPPKFDWEKLQTRKFRAPILPSKDFQKYIDTESGYEFDKVVVVDHRP